MREVSISFSVYCKWVVTPPGYRIYVDNDLLTERTYIWRNDEQYVKEHVLVELEPGVHTLEIIPVNPDISRFKIHDLKIDNVPDALTNNRFTVH